MAEIADQHRAPKSDIEIAQAARFRPMADVAGKLGIPADALVPYGRHKAKLDLNFITGLEDRPDGKLILVTAISPTPAGEGKTTTSVGLADGIARLGRKVALCLREPSLGPVFGQKGGAAGGGYAQVVPMEDINFHFTGDFHAIAAANNLLTAMIDNHVYWGNELGLDLRRPTFRRTLDMNDRVLRKAVIGMGGPAGGIVREEGWDIVAASEVMAVFCLAKNMADLSARLARMVVGQTRERALVRAENLNAVGALTALLRDAYMPNMVQTLEGTPAFVHGGPFANIAHGCNTVIATRAALKLADYTVTEAGFGADLGAEKFFDIKCRTSGLSPAAAVLVCTIRALKMHGGAAKADLKHENLQALQKGFANLERHVENLRKFGVPVVVAVNRFSADTEAERAMLVRQCEQMGVPCVESDHWARGGEGAEPLAKKVLEVVDSGVAKFQPLYPTDRPLAEKIRTIARELYRAGDVEFSGEARTRLNDLQVAGFGDLPVCIAKTQYSFSADAKLMGAPSGHILPVREARLSAGAGFVVAICGEIMTMPGLPRKPAAEGIGVDEQGRITGLS
jgi:formate--tetrahydrofolate ligase